MLEPNMLLQNRYLVLRPIGRGGMGTVYEATDTRLRSTVALKETLLTDNVSRRAFEREAQLLARLRHPVLPKVIDHFTEESGQFLVMEYIAGDDLAALMEKRGGRFPPSAVLPWVLQWADQLLDALDYLHGHAPPVYHRDIKPQNLKLTARGDIILLDFGLAKGGMTEMSTLTARGERLMGFTPNYAPLEQIRGSDPDPRSDLYSLGATLYNLLTGMKPPDALTRAAALLNDQTDPLLPASDYNAHVTAAVAACLQQSLASNPDERFQSAREMRKALNDARDNKASVAAPQTVATGQQAGQAGQAGQPGQIGQSSLPFLTPNVMTAIAQQIAAPQTIITSSDDQRNRESNDVSTHSVVVTVSPMHAPASPPPSVAMGTLLETFHTGSPVLCMAISPDGQKLAVGCDDHSVGIWDMQEGELLHTLTGHRRGVASVAFSPDGRLLASGSEDNLICLWDACEGQLLSQREDHADPVECVAISPADSVLAFGGWSDSVFLCQIENDAFSEGIELPAAFVHSLAFSSDGQMLAAGCYDTTVRLWRMSDRHPLHTLAGHSNFVLTVAFSPNGKMLASAGGETDIHLWRVKDGRMLDTLKGHSNFVRSLAYSPDGKILASGSEDKNVRLWRTSDGSPLHKFEGHNDGVTSVLFTLDGKQLISGSRDAKIRLWQAS